MKTDVKGLMNQDNFQIMCYWGVSLISTFVAAWLLTWLLYCRFLEMPSRITIENQYEPVNNLPYPSIALCSPNQITLSALKHFNRTLVEGNRSIDFNDASPLLLGFYELTGDFDQGLISHVEALVEANRYHAIDIMAMVAQKCEDFLILCLFEGKAYPNCNTLFSPVLTKIGMCCIFNNVYQFRNNKRNEKTKDFKLRRIPEKFAGIGRGLKVVADYNPDDAVDGTVVNAGAIRVMIMESTEFPSEDESNLVRPYTESFHNIHPTYTYCSEDVKALPSSSFFVKLSRKKCTSRSRKCLFQHEKTVRHFGDYGSNDCSLLCHIDRIERHCHCLMHYVPRVRHERACNISSIPCIIAVKVQLTNWQEDDCDCPRDCESFNYRSEVMLGNLNALEQLVVNP
ncbi:sodium channel protein Nach [Pieris rapae]|uniref:sodium channel protein Nach n=1 Tax=Pieris rapae TaxID=64459 RepID=UPI001E27A4B9|nr:sodium channel protein Nach [Pieris rapae]